MKSLKMIVVMFVFLVGLFPFCVHARECTMKVGESCNLIAMFSFTYAGMLSIEHGGVIAAYIRDDKRVFYFPAYERRNKLPLYEFAGIIVRVKYVDPWKLTISID